MNFGSSGSPGGWGIPKDHTRSEGGRGGVQEGPKTDHEILEQPLIDK